MVSMSSDFSILSDNDDLPIGWDKVELDKLLTQTENIIPADYEDELFELWSVPAFPSNEPEFLKGSEIGSNKQKVRQDDVLLCKINPRINRVWKVGKTTEFSQIASTEWIVFRSYGINPDFLVYKFQEPSFREELCENVSGVGGSLIRARPQEIKKLEILIAPLNEQRRIVEKVEALMARSRRAKEALDAIPKLIEQFRQSVLAAAFRGDLTADWREQNPNIEPASILMESLQTGIFRKPPDEILGKLPEKWEWARFADVANIKSNLVDLSEYQNYPHIAPNHIRSGTGELLEYTTIAEDKVFSAKHLFKSGQILYSKIRPYLAKAVIVDFEGLCSADMYPIDSLINTSYLHRWMISSEFTELASGKQGRTVLPKINQNALNELCVPVPPLEEQAKIVEYVENALTYIHQLMETNFQVTTNLELLNQSILSKAFKGELVEQDPTDEPASVLLERIQKEREKEKKQLSRQVQKNKKNRN
jgi:type I restriction enzyme, S subunit